MKKLLVIPFFFFTTILVEAQAVFDTGSKVGINNASPESQLHIGDGTGVQELRIDGDQAKLRLLAHTPSQSAWFQWGTDWVQGNTADLHFSGIFGEPSILTLKGNRNVGIGTTNPTARLDVRGRIRCLNNNSAGGTIMQSLYDPDANYARAIFSHNAYWDFTTNQWNIMGQGANDAQTILIPNKGGFNFIVHQSEGNFSKSLSHADFVAGTKMVLTRDGRLGVGTRNPGPFRLAINGKIRAKEVKVETGWSDFVFEDDYDLPTLEEVEDFIIANGHLPEIPSANEVEKNGVNLGEMDSKLLQKIEELTLYIIDLHKEINKLKKEAITPEITEKKF